MVTSRMHGRFHSLLLLSFIGLALMKYVSTFMLAGGKVHTAALKSSRGGVASNVAMSARPGRFDDFKPNLPEMPENVENAAYASGIIGGFLGVFFVPLVNGLGMGAILAGIFYLISNGEATKLLGTTEKGKEMIPTATSVGDKLQEVGTEVVKLYNAGAVQINEQINEQIEKQNEWRK